MRQKGVLTEKEINDHDDSPGRWSREVEKIGLEVLFKGKWAFFGFFLDRLILK